jgi:hypothetical protein
LAGSFTEQTSRKTKAKKFSRFSSFSCLILAVAVAE